MDGNGNAITDKYHVGNQNPFRYRGYYYDTETGFYYLQSRYYDPEICRFINADSAAGANGDAISYNLFAYCSNDPLHYSDYTGEWAASLGASGSAECIWGVNASTGVAFDGQGSVGLQSSYAGRDTESYYMSAGPSASLQLTGSFYWGVDSIGELEQSQVVVAGISIGPFTIDLTFKDGKPIGISAGFGIGAGDFGMHVYSPKSLETHYFRDKRQPETNQNSASTGNNSTNNDPNRRLFYVDEVTDLLNDPNHKFIHVNEFSVYKVY